MDDIDLRTGRPRQPGGSGGGEPPPSRRQESAWLGRVKFLLGTLFGILVTIIALGLLQRVLPEGLRPSQILAMLAADYQSTAILGTVEALRYQVSQLEQEKSITAQQLEEAKAKSEAYVKAVEGAFQQQQKITEGKVQIVNDAYRLLFDRSKQLVALNIKMTQDFMDRRMQVAQANLAGGSMVIIGSDLVRALGIMTDNPALAQKADQLRQGTQEAQMRELDNVISRAMPQIDPNLFNMVGVPDPAKLAAELELKPIVLPPPPLMPIAPPRAQRPAMFPTGASRPVP